MKKLKPLVKLDAGFICRHCRIIIRPAYTKQEAQELAGPVLCDKCLSDLVNKYPTKHQIGFTHQELISIMKMFPTLNKDRFFDLLDGITCQTIEGEIITYHCDVLLALTCGLENRKPTGYEWD